MGDNRSAAQQLKDTWGILTGKKKTAVVDSQPAPPPQPKSPAQGQDSIDIDIDIDQR